MGAAPQSVIAVTGSLNPLRWIYDAEAYWYNVANGIQNLDGTYTAKGKQQMQDSQAAALIKASGGKMPPADAQAQAAADLTAVLVSDNADPTQDPFAVGNWMKYAAIAAAGLAAIVLVKD